jgi:hypothetical protein
MRKIHYIALAGAVLGSAAVYFGWTIAASAAVGAAAMAKVTCSCVFIHERTLEACRADDPPGFEQIEVVIDRVNKSATGTVFSIINRRAKFTQEFGCTLEP